MVPIAHVHESGDCGKAPKMPDDDGPIDHLGGPIPAVTAKDEFLSLPSTAKQYAGELGIHSDISPDNQYEPQAVKSQSTPSEQELTLLETSQRSNIASPQRQKLLNGQGAYGHAMLEDTSLTARMHNISTIGDGEAPSRELKLGSIFKAARGVEKLGTFSGVFVPTTLNVLSVLMFLRFGFILGQSGVVGMMGMLFNLRPSICMMTNHILGGKVCSS